MNLKFRILFFAFTIAACVSYGQNITQKKIVLQKVFDNIVNAYGNAKAPPLLQLIPKSKSEGNPAFYSSTPVPTIKIEEQAFDICMQLGDDSLNALSIILSHELAHYYNDHTWCSDFSYAIKNSQLGKTLRDLSKADRIKYETQADNSGFYYSCISGYSPFGIYDKLIDKIYVAYKLPNNVPGYPTKDERKMIAQKAQEKIRQLYPVFEAGTILTYASKYEEAISCFNYLNKFFPSRENYNNLGVARLLLALKLKPLQAVEFIYPVEIDAVSRLKIAGTRGLDEDRDARITDLLQAAKKDFETAVRLDPGYTKPYINLACVYDVMGNYEAAIGRINEITSKAKDDISALEIKAIAYAHSENDKKANETFLQIQNLTKDTARYNYKMFELSRESLFSSESFKQQWLSMARIDSSYLKLVNDEIERAKNSDSKINNTETKTQISDIPSFTVMSQTQKNSLLLTIQNQDERLNIQKYLLPEKFNNTNVGELNWRIINEKPFIMLQRNDDKVYQIIIY